MSESAQLKTSPQTALTLRGHGKLASVDPREVLERYLAEERSEDIAKSFGVTFSGLSHWLLTHAEGEWKSAQLVLALKRKDEADRELDSASNALEIARARERLRSAQWDLERVCRRIYGQDSAAATAAAVQINIGITRDSKVSDVQVIDVEAKHD